MTTKTRKILMQSLIGLLITGVSFIFGIIICEFCIPSDSCRYGTPCGECIVGGIIFFASLIFWSIFRWKISALFIISGIFGLYIIFLPIVAAVYSWDFTLINDVIVDIIKNKESGIFKTLWMVWRHTCFPVFCAAIVLFFLKLTLKKYRV